MPVLEVKVDEIDPLKKYDPYHDALGRFTSAPNAVTTTDWQNLENGLVSRSRKSYYPDMPSSTQHRFWWQQGKDQAHLEEPNFGEASGRKAEVMHRGWKFGRAVHLKRPQLAVALTKSLEDVEKNNPNHIPAGQPGAGQFAPKGSGFSFKNGQWVDSNGKPASAKVQERIKKLGISPGYKDVRLHPSETHPMQARIVDAKGREKRIYSAAHNEEAKAEKFNRLRDFHKARPGILKGSEEDLKNPSSPHHDSATVLHVIDRTGFRPGSMRETGGNVKAFGATTLQGQHVSVAGGKASFKFIGKNGKLITHTLEDPTLSKNLAVRKLAAGKTGQLFPNTDEAKLRDYLSSKGGDKFLIKDFRTYRGTAIARDELAHIPHPKTEKEFKAMRKSVATTVSKHLGNTPTMALKAYIDPTVWNRHGGERWK